MMNSIDKARNLYVVDDKKAIKNYIRQDIDYWTRFGKLPSLGKIIDDLLDNEDFVAQSYEDSIALKKDWLEMVSVYDIAKTIRDSVVYTVDDDLEESKSIKLRIRESIEDIDFSYLDDMFAVVKDYLRKEFDSWDDLEYEFKEIPGDTWFAEILFTRTNTGGKALFTCEYKDAYDGIIYATYNYHRNRNGKEDVFYSQKDFVDWLADEVADRLY
jgi:hypothetical protein